MKSEGRNSFSAYLYDYLNAVCSSRQLEKECFRNIEKAEKKVFMPKCPCCKTGNLHRILIFDQRGPPPEASGWYLGHSQTTSSCEN